MLIDGKLNSVSCPGCESEEVTDIGEPSGNFLRLGCLACGNLWEEQYPDAAKATAAASQGISDSRLDSYLECIKNHGRKLLVANSEDHVLARSIQQFAGEEMSALAAQVAVAAKDELETSGSSDTAVSGELMTPSALVISTVSNNDFLPVVARSFSGGYLTWLQERLDGCRRGGDPPLGHWIFLHSPVTGMTTTHLTLFQRDKQANKVLAWDLLSPRELTMIGQKDTRPEGVKLQWEMA